MEFGFCNFKLCTLHGQISFNWPFTVSAEGGVLGMPVEVTMAKPNQAIADSVSGT